jgi:hypothetical protein
VNGGGTGGYHPIEYQGQGQTQYQVQYQAQAQGGSYDTGDAYGNKGGSITSKAPRTVSSGPADVLVILALIFAVPLTFLAQRR